MKAWNPNPELVTLPETAVVGEGERWGCHCSSGSVWKARAAVRLNISQAAIKIGIKQWERQRGESHLGNSRKEVRWGEGGGEGDRVKGEWIRRDRSDSSGATESEECRLFLPLQTSCPATSPTAVINTCYSLLSAFQSIDKSTVRPAGTMALSSAPSDVGWIVAALVVGMVQEELFGDMSEYRNGRKGLE